MDYLRQVVSGKSKKRFVNSHYNLDLTYVCPRIIAMSYPAEGIEGAYRNKLVDVSKFLKERHGSNFKVYNLSGRLYDKSKFSGELMNKGWDDHHSPPIDFLFEICNDIHTFLQIKYTNVVVIHCLAGKGRTGTVICCYLLYTGRFSTADQALTYYHKKRGAGVTQPSQVRYVKYFEKIFFAHPQKFYAPKMKEISEIKLLKIPSFNGEGCCRPFIEIYSVKDKKQIYIDNENLVPKVDKPWSTTFDNKILKACGDIQFKICHIGFMKKGNMFRFAFNTAFVEENSVKLAVIDVDPDSLRKDSRFPKGKEPAENYIVEIILNDREVQSEDDKKMFEDEKLSFEKIYAYLKEYKKPTSMQGKILLFGDPDFDDIEEVLGSNKIGEKEEADDQDSENSDDDADEEEKKENQQQNNQFNHNSQPDAPLQIYNFELFRYEEQINKYAQKN